MKRVFLFILLASIPVLLFAGVWQVYSFQRLEAEVSALEAEQNEWFEENKRKIIGIEYLSSPRRLDQIAREELELEKADSDQVIRVVVPSPTDESDG